MVTFRLPSSQRLISLSVFNAKREEEGFRCASLFSQRSLKKGASSLHTQLPSLERFLTLFARCLKSCLVQNQAAVK